MVINHSKKITMINVNNFKSDSLEWLNNPRDYHSENNSGIIEGSGGDFTLSESGDKLSIKPPAFKDFWCRTFYEPLLIKHDASALLCAIPNEVEVTVKVDFEYKPVLQFDQAGLLLYLDNDHWLKCGIEFCDGTPKLSVVCCNYYSDWSTQPWNSFGVRLRIHKVHQSESIVVEAAPIGTTDYKFIRIAHISSNSNRSSNIPSVPNTAAVPWRIGPYAACPTKQQGCIAHFTQFSIGPREASVHSSEGDMQNI